MTISCNQKATKSESKITTNDNITTRFYSKIIADTFLISVRLPNDYDPKEKYPIVYVLDANIYFDILV